MSKDGLDILKSMSLSLTCIKDSLSGINEGVETLVGRKKAAMASSVKTIIDDWFEEQWGNYPKKEGKKRALSHFKASVKTKEDLDRFKIALANYKDKTIDDDFKYIKSGSTFFYNWEDYVDLDTKSAHDRFIDFAKGMDE